MKFNCYILLVLSLISCSSSKKKENENSTSEVRITTNSMDALNDKTQPKKDQLSYGKETDLYYQLDDLLNCDEYSYRDYYFIIPYYGCIYDPENNKDNVLGWASCVLIIENNKLLNLNDYDKISEEEKKVSQMSKADKKNNFIPLVFLVDKKYLSKHENVEVLYYPDSSYMYKMYAFDRKKDKWQLKDSVIVKDEAQQGEWKFRKISNYEVTLN